jgi:uncharacterized protein (TIRG00374 family)
MVQILKTTPAIRRVGRTVVALCILFWLANSVGIDRIVAQLAHVSLPLLLAATALLAVDGVAKARNWQQLLAASVGNVEVPFLRVLRWHFAGGFIGAIVPSSAGTDACRVLMGIRGLGGQAAPCAASILTVNCLGWFTGSAIGLVGAAVLAFEGDMPRLLQPVTFVFLFTLIVLPVIYAVLASKRAWAVAFIERVGQRSAKLREGVTRFLDALLVFEHAHVRFPTFLSVSTLGLLAQMGMFALTAKALGLDLPFAVWMVLVPLTRIVALVPVSIADFGLIQAAHVWVLALFGVPASQAFALSALFAVEGLLIHSTIGSAAFVFRGRRNPALDAVPARSAFSLDGPKSVR